MGDLYDDIKWCEAQPSWWCMTVNSVAWNIFRDTRATYGGPLFEYYTCPPGDEPPAPQQLYAAIASQHWYPEYVDAAGDADVRAYILEQYELAYNAWRGRVEWCSGKEAPPPAPPPEPTPPPGPSEPLPPKNGNGNDNDKPPKGAPPPPKDNGKIEEAGINLGIVAIAAGIALIVASRRRR